MLVYTNLTLIYLNKVARFVANVEFRNYDQVVTNVIDNCCRFVLLPTYIRVYGLFSIVTHTFRKEKCISYGPMTPPYAKTSE